jgi:hypothetical protein
LGLREKSAVAAFVLVPTDECEELYRFVYLQAVHPRPSTKAKYMFNVFLNTAPDPLKNKKKFEVFPVVNEAPCREGGRDSGGISPLLTSHLGRFIK